MDETKLRAAAAQVAQEWKMGGLTGGIYEDFAVEVAKRAVADERWLWEMAAYKLTGADAGSMAMVAAFEDIRGILRRPKPECWPWISIATAPAHKGPNVRANRETP